jgi:hypothetical protein
MNTTNLIKIVPLVVAMVGLAMAKQAHATNESSYQWGYHDGFNDYKFYIANSAGADVPSSNPTSFCQIYHNGALVSPNGVTNQTACHDGYVNGWRDWGKTDMKDCLDLVLGGYFRDIHQILKDDNKP